LFWDVPFSHNTFHTDRQTDDDRTQHCSISATVLEVLSAKNDGLTQSGNSALMTMTIRQCCVIRRYAELQIGRCRFNRSP